jgi:hypothetical protein
MHIYWNWRILRSFQDLRAVLLKVRVFCDAALSLKAKTWPSETSETLIFTTQGNILEDINNGAYQSAIFRAQFNGFYQAAPFCHFCQVGVLFIFTINTLVYFTINSPVSNVTLQVGYIDRIDICITIALSLQRKAHNIYNKLGRNLSFHISSSLVINHAITPRHTCMYVCMYVYIYTYICMYMYLCIYVCMAPRCGWARIVWHTCQVQHDNCALYYARRLCALDWLIYNSYSRWYLWRSRQDLERQTGFRQHCCVMRCR